MSPEDLDLRHSGYNTVKKSVFLKESILLFSKIPVFPTFLLDGPCLGIIYALRNSLSVILICV